MKYTFAIETEDLDDLKIYVTAVETFCNVDSALKEIRSRIKYEETSDKEVEFLEVIREILTDYE